MNIDRDLLYDGSKDLVQRLADRMPKADVEIFLSLHDVGEPLYLLNLLCAGLTTWKTPVTPDERDTLATLVVGVATTDGEHYPYLVDIDGTFAALKVVEQPDDRLSDAVMPRGTRPRAGRAGNPPRGSR